MSIINSLPQYVEDSNDRLLRDAILGSKTAQMLTLQTGVKTQSAINLLSTSVVFQDGSGCGFSANGTSSVSQRIIKAPIIKVNMEFCDKTLLNSSMQHGVRVAAGQKTLPFEQDFIAGVVEKVDNAVDQIIWQGDTTSTDLTLKWSDGLIKILKADSDNVVKYTTAISATTVEAIIDNVFMAIPPAVLNSGNVKIFMGYDTFRTYLMAIRDKNYYHYNANGIDGDKFYYMGSNVEMVAVSGLDGTGVVVAGSTDNLFYGTDLSGDDEKFDFWYSKDDGVFKLAIEFAIGVQVAYPDSVVISYYEAVEEVEE